MKSIFRDGDGEDALDRQQRNEMHRQNLQAAGNTQRNVDKEYLQEITDNQLDDHTIALMSNLVGADYVLSYLQSAEINEIKWIARSIARKIKRMHPPQESVVQGEYRKFLLDDSRDALQALTPHQENLIDQGMLEFFTRVARSRDGWQQDEMSKQLRVSKTEDDTGDDDTGGFFG